MRCGGRVITIQEITPYMHCCLARPRTYRTLIMGQRLINHDHMQLCMSRCVTSPIVPVFFCEVVLEMVQRNNRATNIVIRKIFISII